MRNLSVLIALLSPACVACLLARVTQQHEDGFTQTFLLTAFLLLHGALVLSCGIGFGLIWYRSAELPTSAKAYLAEYPAARSGMWRNRFLIGQTALACTFCGFVFILTPAVVVQLSGTVLLFLWTGSLPGAFCPPALCPPSRLVRLSHCLPAFSLALFSPAIVVTSFGIVYIYQHPPIRRGKRDASLRRGSFALLVTSILSSAEAREIDEDKLETSEQTEQSASSIKGVLDKLAEAPTVEGKKMIPALAEPLVPARQPTGPRRQQTACAKLIAPLRQATAPAKLYDMPYAEVERHERGVSAAFLRALVKEFGISPEEPTWSVCATPIMDFW